MNMWLFAKLLRQHCLPHPMRKKTEQFDPSQDRIKVVTLHVSKGLEFPVVALVGVGHMPAKGEDEREGARLFCVAAARATQRVVIGVSGVGQFAA